MQTSWSHRWNTLWKKCIHYVALDNRTSDNAGKLIVGTGVQISSDCSTLLVCRGPVGRLF